MKLKKIEKKNVGLLFTNDFTSKRGEKVLEDLLVKIDEHTTEDNDYVPSVTSRQAYETLFNRDYRYGESDVVYKYSVLFDTSKFINGIINTSMVLSSVLNDLFVGTLSLPDKIKTFELFQNGFTVTFVGGKTKLSEVDEVLARATEKSHVNSKSLLVTYSKGRESKFFFHGNMKMSTFSSVFDTSENIEDLKTILMSFESDKRFISISQTEMFELEYFITAREERMSEDGSDERSDIYLISVDLSKGNVERIEELVRYARALKVILIINDKKDVEVSSNLLANTIKVSSAKRILNV